MLDTFLRYPYFTFFIQPRGVPFFFITRQGQSTECNTSRVTPLIYSSERINYFLKYSPHLIQKNTFCLCVILIVGSVPYFNNVVTRMPFFGVTWEDIRSSFLQIILLENLIAV